MWSSFIHPQVISILFMNLESVKHKRRYFWDVWEVSIQWKPRRGSVLGSPRFFKMSSFVFCIRKSKRFGITNTITVKCYYFMVWPFWVIAYNLMRTFFVQFAFTPVTLWLGVRQKFYTIHNFTIHANKPHYEFPWNQVGMTQGFMKMEHIMHHKENVHCSFSKSLFIEILNSSHSWTSCNVWSILHLLISWASSQLIYDLFKNDKGIILFLLSLFHSLLGELFLKNTLWSLLLLNGTK